MHRALAMVDYFLGHFKNLLILLRILNPLHLSLVQAGLFRSPYQVKLSLGNPELDAVLLVIQVVQLGLLLRLRFGEALLLLLKSLQLLLLALPLCQ